MWRRRQSCCSVTESGPPLISLCISWSPLLMHTQPLRSKFLLFQGVPPPPLSLPLFHSGFLTSTPPTCSPPSHSCCVASPPHASSVLHLCCINQSLCELLSLVSWSSYNIPLSATITCSNWSRLPPFFETNVRLKTPPTPAGLPACLAVSKKWLSAAYPCLCSAFTFICENLCRTEPSHSRTLRLDQI